MGTSNSPHVMTLVNSIIGVSILAMPFCYHQCGILLASLILVFINMMTRLSCHYLLKSAIMTRRKNFEFLAFHAFGRSGKTAIELCIILLMIGTCIAFFVVMGDLGPAIISSLLEMEFSAALRPAVLICLAVFVVLPLGMLRNVDSLSFICTLSFLFYLLLVLKVFFESADNLFASDWLNEVNYWRPAGLLQCLPIFSMALSCQTQLFEIFDSVTNATLDRMNLIVKYAVDLCTALYISVGILGYIAYYKTSMTGNLLMSFSESIFSEIIKLFFVLSVAVTFPLVIFPCRASLYSLLFRKGHVPTYELVTGGGNHIPEAQFKCITLFIITSSLVVGLLAPNIEIVLGLVGSTIGVVICLLFPPLLFIWISTKATTEKVLAQMMCMVGIFIMIMGTYANLFMSDSVNNEVQNWKAPETLQAMESKVDIGVPLNPLDTVNVVKPSVNDVKDIPKLKEENKKSQDKIIKAEIQDKPLPLKEQPKDDKRIEPPIPIAPEALKPDHAPEAIKAEPKIEIKDSPKIEPLAKPIQNKDQIKIESEQPNNAAQKSSLPVPNKEDAQLKADDILQQKSIQNKPKEEIKQIENIPKVPKSGEKPPDTKLSQDVSDFMKSKPPLPILMNNNSQKKEKPEEKVIQRDILGNIKNTAEREKRDLFATNATLKQAPVKSDIPEVEEEYEPDSGFVKNIAESVKSNQTCDNDKLPKDQNKVETPKEANIDILSHTRIETENVVVEKPKDVKEELIIAPSKLTDPLLILEQKVPENNNVKPHPENIMKPMLRELKAAEAKEPTDNRKK